MAIKLRNISPDAAIWGNQKHSEHNGLIREFSMTIHNTDGSVTGDTINFGRIGDNNITRLGFDLKDFNLQSEEDDYEATLLFKSIYYDIYKITLERCGKNQFCIVLTDSILRDIYDYCGGTNIKMIVVLNESTNSNDYDNVPGIREQFVSNEFSGYFTTSNAQQITGNQYWNPFDVRNEYTTILKDTDDNNSLLKQNIKITYSGGRLSANTTLAGNQYDSYVKRIVLDLDELANTGWSNMVVSMLVENGLDDLKLYEWDGSMAWLPEELTATFGTKNIWFKITSDDKIFISNMLTLTVKENWLDNSYFEKEIILTDATGVVLTDTNGLVLYTKEA